MSYKISNMDSLPFTMMPISHSVEQIKKLWQRLSRPSERFDQFLSQYQQGLLAALLFVGAIGIALVLALELLLNRDTYTPISTEARLLSLGLIGLYYVLLRQGKLSIPVMVYSATAVIFAIALNSGTRITESLYFICFTLLVSCLFMTLRHTLVVIAVQVGGLLAISFSVSEGLRQALYQGPIPFYVVCASISILVVYDFKALFTDYLDRLTESETRYRMVSKLVSDYAFFVRFKPDGGMTFEWVTDALSQITGYNAEEVSFQTHQYFHPDDTDRLNADIEAVRRGEATSSEYRARTKAGEIRWLHISRQPLKDNASGQVIGYYGSVKDITERKASDEQKLELSLEQERVRSVIQFASAFSHYFRNVLSSIETNRHIIQRVLDSQLPPTVETHLQRISTNITRLHDQLDNMTIVSRLMTHPAQPVHLAKIVEAMLPTYQTRAMRKEITLSYEPNGQLPAVSAYMEDVSRVVDYLLTNAVQRTPPNGQVSVRAASSDKFVSLEVTDTGEAIPPDKLPYIFDFFYHASASNDIEQSGAALGLTIARMVAEHYGGTLTADSVIGQGNCFKFSLPLA
jgi:PAS domain S-box-containing protein